MTKISKVRVFLKFNPNACFIAKRNIDQQNLKKLFIV